MSEAHALAPVVRRNSSQGNVVWTAELQAEVMRLWLSGKSGGEIGAAMGLSRSSVIGFVHRHNLKVGGTRAPTQPRAVIEKPAKPKPEPKPRRMSLPKPPPPPPEPIRAPRAAPPPESAWMPLEGSNPAPLVGRPYRTCGWPVGFVDGEMMACCNPTREGKTPDAFEAYCEPHARRAYYPPKESPARFSKGVRKWAR